jgi:hypothetical protein
MISSGLPSRSGAVADAHDEDLVMHVELAPREVGDHSYDQARLARAARPDDV